MKINQFLNIIISEIKNLRIVSPKKILIYTSLCELGNNNKKRVNTALIIDKYFDVLPQDVKKRIKENKKHYFNKNTEIKRTFLFGIIILTAEKIMSCLLLNGFFNKKIFFSIL